MKTSSAKNKGRRLQQYVRDKVLELYPVLTDRDVRSTPMGVSGEDLQLSEVASKLFPFSVETKNQENISIWKALEQSISDNRNLTPLLVFKRNNSNVYCALKFEDFLRLVRSKDDGD